MSNAFTPVISETLTNEGHKVFIATAKKEAAVRAANTMARGKAVNKLLDAMVIACDKPKAEFLKGNAKTNDARGQIKAFFDRIVKEGALEKSTAASYQSGFWIAFQTGVEWSADLNNKKTADKQAGEAKTSTKASGAVQSTSRKDLDKTLSKALAQARLLGLTEFAADVLDLCVDCLDGFTETVLDK